MINSLKRRLAVAIVPVVLVLISTGCWNSQPTLPSPDTEPDKPQPEEPQPQMTMWTLGVSLT
jgi:hypothetical protein